jgi:hypothetical protein
VSDTVLVIVLVIVLVMGLVVSLTAEVSELVVLLADFVTEPARLSLPLSPPDGLVDDGTLGVGDTEAGLEPPPLRVLPSRDIVPPRPSGSLEPEPLDDEFDEFDDGFGFDEFDDGFGFDGFDGFDDGFGFEPLSSLGERVRDCTVAEIFSVVSLVVAVTEGGADGAGFGEGAAEGEGESGRLTHLSPANGFLGNSSAEARCGVSPMPMSTAVGIAASAIALPAEALAQVSSDLRRAAWRAPVPVPEPSPPAPGSSGRASSRTVPPMQRLIVPPLTTAVAADGPRRRRSVAGAVRRRIAGCPRSRQSAADERRQVAE